MRIHAQSLQDLCHTKKETSLLLTNRNSKISKEDSTSSFLKISHLYGRSYWSTCKNPVVIHLPVAKLEMAIQKLSSRHLKNWSLSLHLMISSNTELMLSINRWAVAKYLTTNSTTKILPSVNSETKRPMQATIYTWITNYQKQNAHLGVLILHIGMLFLFWIDGCCRSSAKWAFHLNLVEWTLNIAMLKCFLIVNA